LHGTRQMNQSWHEREIFYNVNQLYFLANLHNLKYNLCNTNCCIVLLNVRGVRLTYVFNVFILISIHNIIRQFYNNDNDK